MRSVLSKGLLSETVKFDFVFIQGCCTSDRCFRHQNITGMRALFSACSQLSSKHWAELEEVLASAGRNSRGSAGSESLSQCLKSCTCCQSRREGCSSGLHCNSGILGSNSKALNGFVSRPSPFLTDGEIGLNTELMAKLRLAQASSSYKAPKQHQIGKSLSNSDKSFR